MTTGLVTASECRRPASDSAWEYMAPRAMMVTAASTPKAVTASRPHAERIRRGSSHSNRSMLCITVRDYSWSLRGQRGNSEAQIGGQGLGASVLQRDCHAGTLFAMTEAKELSSPFGGDAVAQAGQ